MTRLWIETRLKEVKKKKIDLGKALGLPPSRISDIIGGNRRIHSHEIPLLSVFLDLNMGTILNYIHRENNTEELEDKSQTEQIAVVGTLKASRSCYALWPARDHYTVTLPIQASYTGVPKFALEENGPVCLTKKIHICVKEVDFETPLKSGLVRIMDNYHECNQATSTVKEGTVSQKADIRTSAIIAFIIGRYQQF